jgi:hypothetical protein
VSVSGTLTPAYTLRGKPGIKLLPTSALRKRPLLTPAPKVFVIG